MSASNVYLHHTTDGLDDVTSVERDVTTCCVSSGGGYLVPNNIKMKHKSTDSAVASPLESRHDKVINTLNGASNIMKQQERESVVGLKGHDYEELPSTGGTFLSNDYLHTTELPTSFTSNTFSVQHQPPATSYRKRDNPLYDSNRFKPERSSTHETVKSSVSVVFLLTGLCLLFSATAVVLSIISITMSTSKQESASSLKTAWPDKLTTSSDINVQLLQLETDVLRLHTQVNQLMSILNSSSPADGSYLLIVKVDELMSVALTHGSALGQLNKSQVMLNESFSNIIASLKTQQQNFSSQINDLKMNLNGRIENVTKMPGLQGSTGAGNLSACSHLVNSSGGASAFPETPSGVVDLSAGGPMQGWVLTGALCTTTGGTQAMLKYNQNSPNVYQCVCKGVDNSAASRYCELHYWICPKT